MLGALISWGVLDRRAFPQGFTLLCVWFTLLSAIGAELFSSNAATTAHMGGFIAGAVWVVAEVIFKKLKKQNEVDPNPCEAAFDIQGNLK